jgi:hypothetical protein
VGQFGKEERGHADDGRGTARDAVVAAARAAISSLNARTQRMTALPGRHRQVLKEEVSGSIGPVTTYVVNRMTIPTGMGLSKFRSRFEDAVPPLPLDQVGELVNRGAPWGEMVDLVQRAAPWGFLLYWTNDVDRIVRLACDSDSAVAYLMGNHIIMERMFRYEPSVVMYAPLHVAIWSRLSDGQAFFTIDKPSDQFGSFADPRVTAVGYELDANLGVLLSHLGLKVPDTLSRESPPRLRGH